MVTGLESLQKYINSIFESVQFWSAWMNNSLYFILCEKHFARNEFLTQCDFYCFLLLIPQRVNCLNRYKDTGGTLSDQHWGKDAKT